MKKSSFGNYTIKTIDNSYKIQRKNIPERKKNILCWDTWEDRDKIYESYFGKHQRGYTQYTLRQETIKNFNINNRRHNCGTTTCG
jgi:hypothetical protein